MKRRGLVNRMLDGIKDGVAQAAISVAIGDVLSYLDPVKQETPQGDEYLIRLSGKAVLVTVRDFPLDMADRIVEMNR